MSSSTTELEEDINSFIHARTGEKIYLDLSLVGNVILKPLCTRGSNALGAFWVKLLQHPNNYPVSVNVFDNSVFRYIVVFAEFQ